MTEHITILIHFYNCDYQVITFESYRAFYGWFMQIDHSTIEHVQKVDLLHIKDDWSEK